MIISTNVFYRKKMFHKFIIYFSLILILFFSSCDSINLYFDRSKTTENDQELPFYIKTDTNIETVFIQLESQGIVSDTESLKRIADYKELNSERIAAGKYIIAPATKLSDLLNGFTLNSLGNGNQELEVKVTFNNCRFISDLADKVSTQLECDSLELISYILADSTLNKYGFNEATIPALFLPNTYKMFWDTDPSAFVKRMAKEFKNFWTPERMAQLSEVGLKSQSEAVTLASMVYKEQDKHKEEWAIIAGLYLNRLKNGWKLQSDPTFRFCWGKELDGVQRLTYEHRKKDCPYNTYLYAGLPPGPIYFPPAEVIDAVLSPDSNNYFYMCAKPDGNGLHNFANSLREHNNNARRYQNWLNQQRIK